jgi:hypothetical protein
MSNTQQAKEAQNKFENVDPAFKGAIVEAAIDKIAKATNKEYRDAVISTLKTATVLSGSIGLTFALPPIGLMLSGLAGLTALGLPVSIATNIKEAGKEAVEKMNIVLTKMNATADKAEQKSIMLEAYPALYARFPRETTQSRVADVLSPPTSGGGSSSTMARVYAQAAPSGGGGASATHRYQEERPLESLTSQQFQEETRRIIRERKSFEPTLPRE